MVQIFLLKYQNIGVNLHTKSLESFLLVDSPVSITNYIISLSLLFTAADLFNSVLDLVFLLIFFHDHIYVKKVDIL